MDAVFSANKIRYCRDSVRFLVTRRFKGYSIPDRPHFDERSTPLFMSLLENSNFYLEYGSGGSTVVAALLKKPFISVDTDRLFSRAVARKIGALSWNQRLIYVGIGLTGQWGVPLPNKHPSSRRVKKWKLYAETPWRFVSNDQSPDLVLVDGRFRVASALTSLANLASLPHAKVLVDDYKDRPHYHVLESHAKMVGIAGRMAIFQPRLQESQKLYELIDQYSADWR
jgi:hypothetical protein